MKNEWKIITDQLTAVVKIDETNTPLQLELFQKESCIVGLDVKSYLSIFNSVLSNHVSSTLIMNLCAGDQEKCPNNGDNNDNCYP